ncbi:methyl-accepting chemotaxis protein [Clostridium tetanomorphum]|uniref:methyl-accepting chemotaxis protein n=1 Tax=Clostridium tetanomorphum TaxID=1553 RepID=UPI000452EA28|nr:methyl-accepting chemotaxis protein [Clostridium tetanomorphum]KAJ50407.1 methyl-accepting chemotaxis protein [Clostridium tetanomorphum DSM 665]MBP1865779.1 methyl-accepting chemotaxis protein [Clostridium tetanomorphum]NRS86900.1 methyl-accepting chemotaxis protein [Clostridium tetanomorphum]SQC00297.1 methyl-accepting chemotaxis protein [Clostridium tetanomorphum]
MKLNKSITNKILLAFFSLIVIVFFSTGAIVDNYVKKIVIDNSEKSLSNDATILSKNIDDFFSKNKDIVELLSSNQNILDYLNEVKTKDNVKLSNKYTNIVKTLANIKNSNKNLSLVYIVFDNANYIITNDEWKAPSDWNLHSRQWYIDTVAAGKLFFTDPYVDKVTGKMVVSATVPIFDKNKKSLGAVGIDILIDELPAIMSNYKVGDTGYAVLVDKKGTVMYHPDKSKILKDNIAKYEGTLGQIGKRMIKGETAVVGYSFENTDKYFASAPITSNGWSVGVIINKDEVLLKLNSLNKILILIYIISAIILLLISLFIIKYLLKDIPKLLNLINKISQGDLTSREIIKSRDEIGEISNAINNMASNLQTLIEGISSNSHDVSASGQELSATIEEVNSQIQNINSSTQQIAAAMEETSASTEEMNASGLEIKNILDNLKEKYLEGNNFANEIKSKSYSMKIDSENAKTTALNIYKEKQVEILKSIEDGKVVEKITDMAKIIADIAEKTNLLALNASIEAARAGEHGKGFVVVAEEVGTLASQSTKTASNIESTVLQVKQAFENLSNNSHSLLGFMDEKVVSDYNTMIERSELSLKDSEAIADLVGNLTKRSEEITLSMDELISAIDAVAHAVTDVTANISNISQTINQTTEAFDEVSKVAENQSELAQNLNSTIGNFQI